MMRPPSLISGSSFCVRKNGALKWIATNWSNWASVVSTKLAGADAGVVDQKVEVLLCEYILEQAADFADKTIEGAALAHIQLQHRGAATQGLDLLDDRLGLSRCAVVGADDIDRPGLPANALA